MENDIQKNPINKSSTPPFDNNYLSFLERKFTEMNSDLASIYESTNKEDLDFCDKSI